MFFFKIFFLFTLPFGLSAQNSVQLLNSPKDSLKQNFSPTVKLSKVGSIEDYIQINQEDQSEKVFIHLDRPNYVQGDTIWFKAYLWYGYDQLPDTVSGILYVDLVDSEDNIVLKRRHLIQNGSACGNFCLDSTINPGDYTILAYTRLMFNRNSGEPFSHKITINPARQNFQFELLPVIFKQSGNDSLRIGLRFFEVERWGNLNSSISHKLIYNLRIRDHIYSDSIQGFNTKEEKLKYSLAEIGKVDSLAEFEVSIKEANLTFKKRFLIPLQDDIDLQFLPEGGNLVNGLESSIAFKAVGTDGLGREVAGEIRTEDEKVVASFRSSYKGMGTFLLTPLNKMKYFAHFWYKNQKYTIPLPLASDQGTIMSVIRVGNDHLPFIIIKKNPINNIDQKYLVGSSYGKVWFSAAIRSLKDSCKLKIPIELLPEGVCRLTILNEDFHPECERLIYVDKHQRIKIEVAQDSTLYGTRSKITLTLKATYLDGSPAQTNLSVAVVDKAQVAEAKTGNGIKTYKLLKSELRGYIEDPDSYFKEDSCANGSDLDLLLLTHGYRKFLTDIPNSIKHKFLPEKTFDITGQIKINGSKFIGGKINYSAINLTLLTKSENSYLALSKPDSLGRFKFQIPLRNGNCKSLIQATTIKGKPFKGDISLDELVVLPRFHQPSSENLIKVPPIIENITRVQSDKKAEISKLSLGGSMSKTLDEVVVSANAKPKNWWRNYDKDAKMIASLDSLDPSGDRYRGLNDLLCEEFGAHRANEGQIETVTLPCVQTVCEGACLTYWLPIYVIDGKLFWNGKDFDFSPLNTLAAYRVNEIKRILVIPPGKAIAMYYAYDPIIGFPQFILQSLVIIETYQNDHYYRGDPQGVKTFILKGLNESRIFYSPTYLGEKIKSPVYDGRATLYWNPSIRTDVKGLAEIEFYTSDRTTELEVTINGIDLENGYPGEGHRQIHMNFKK